MTVTEVTKTRSRCLQCDRQMDGRFSPAMLEPPAHMQTPCIPRRTSQDGSTSLTRRGNHPLPLLEQRCLETVAGAQRICFVARHQLLHWLQNDTQLYKRHTGALAASVYCTSACKDFSILFSRMEGGGGGGGWKANRGGWRENGGWRANGGGCIKATKFYGSQLLILI